MTAAMEQYQWHGLRNVDIWLYLHPQVRTSEIILYKYGTTTTTDTFCNYLEGSLATQKIIFFPTEYITVRIRRE